MFKSIVLVAAAGIAVAGCSVRTERVVEAPAATTTQRTTTDRPVRAGRHDHDHHLHHPDPLARAPEARPPQWRAAALAFGTRSA